MTILVTGGAGFIGAHFVRAALESGMDVVNLDALTYAGDTRRLADARVSPGYTFINGDIRDAALVDALFAEHKFQTVVNFAAETHVDRSIDGPGVFLETNVLGTGVLLAAARDHWSIRQGDRYCTEYKDGVMFLQVSTDEVYGALGADGSFSETSPLEPNSPYSASKASADMLVRSYNKTYGLPVLITRCSNNYGAWQYPEKLIPLMIKNALKNRKLPVYGDGRQVRDWLHVSDHCSAILTALARGVPGEVYNIGGGCERENIEIVRLILARLGRGDELIEYVRDRPGHDRRYAVDSGRLRALGWAPKYTFETGINETIDWYASHPEWLGE